jgi:hypothetical protein
LEDPDDSGSVDHALREGSEMPASDGPAADRPEAVGVQEVYDAVAQAYDRQFGDELSAKTLDRALLIRKWR